MLLEKDKRLRYRHKPQRAMHRHHLPKHADWMIVIKGGNTDQRFRQAQGEIQDSAHSHRQRYRLHRAVQENIRQIEETGTSAA